METIRFVWRPGDGDLSDAYRVRLRVFCDEQGYRPDMELDEQDAASQHLIAYDGDEPVATGRLYEKAPAVYGLGRSAALPGTRGTAGVGDVPPGQRIGGGNGGTGRPVPGDPLL